MTQNCARLRNSETLGFTQPICDTLPQANYRCHYAPHPSYQSNPSGCILEPAIAQPRFWGSFTRPNSELAELGTRSRPSNLASIINGLLLLDLVFSIPTLTVALLAGYFLGFSQGAGVLLLGLGSAALLAYYTSRWRGGLALQLFLEQS